MKYPFDSSLRHHLLIALGLAIWIFVFLYFTEPLDVNELNASEKFYILISYAIIGCILYVLILPIQYWLYRKQNYNWKLKNELFVSILFVFIAILVLRWFYLEVIMNWHPNAYTFWYHLTAILIPAILTILPIILIARFGLGKYKEKQLEDLKIEIKGEGNYESLRVFLNDIIAIQSSDNYIEVFYISNFNLKKSLIRNKLSVISETFPELLRTHRSYIINPFHFQEWKHDKSKPVLILSYDIEAPISKTYLETVKTTLNFTTT